MALKIQGGEATPADSANGGGGIVTVKGRYDIDTSVPMPQFDAAPAVAYRAVARRDSRRSIYALICDPKMPPRLDAISMIHRIDHRNVQKVVDWAVVDWPPEGRRCPVIIVEQPLGQKYFNSLQDDNKPIHEEQVMRCFIQPMVTALRELHAVGIIHRGIRPDNIYLADDPETGTIISECFSAPAGMTQPTVFETLRDGASTPAGRGEGFATNDMYAFGVMIVSLLTGKVPCRDLTDEEIIRQKVAMGSYAMLTQQARISLTLMEPLRGLLNDDDMERWTLEDVSLWISGRRLSPKQQVMPTKASRGFHFCDEDYLTARELAHAMFHNWAQAAKPIKDGSLDGWLRRSLSEESRVEAVNQAKLALTDGSDNEDRLIARVITALDPQGPIRYKGLACTVDGISSFLALHYEDQEARQLFAQVINAGLPHFWCEQQTKTHSALLPFLTRLDRMRATMARHGLGNGIERVMYELNPSTPCRSQIFERDFVATIDHFLPAMELLATEQGEEVQRFLDRDVAAFISTHFKRGIGNELRDYEDDDLAISAIAQVRILANLQESLARKETFPALCARSVDLLQPAIERFYSRKTRKRISEQLQGLAKQGRLEPLLQILDNRRELEIDQNGFRRSCVSYARSIRETIKLKRDMKNQKKIASDQGGMLSTGVASIVAMIGFMAYVVVSLV
ncbi:MAG: hypothetical protein RIM72_00885 [Alphaproteobacteria bacterium]